MNITTRGKGMIVADDQRLIKRVGTAEITASGKMLLAMNSFTMWSTSLICVNIREQGDHQGTRPNRCFDCILPNLFTKSRLKGSLFRKGEGLRHTHGFHEA